MKAVEILREEHRQIGLLLQCLEVLAERARASGSLDCEPVLQVLYLFETFVDQRHQRKEEVCLFPELLRNAGPDDEAILRSLLEDHEQEFHLLRGMRSHLHGAARGEAIDISELARDAMAYVELQRRHIEHETSAMLPMAERLLSAQGDAEVASTFIDLEGGPGDPHGVREQVRALCKQLGVQDTVSA